MSIPASINDRLEAAALKAEGASEILRRVANDPEGASVATEAGALPSIAEWQRLHAAALGDVPQLAQRLDVQEAFRESLLGDSGGEQVWHGRRSLAERFGEVINVRDYPFNIRPENNDNATQLQALRDLLGTLSVPLEVVFPGGTYRATVWPNWNVPGLVVRAEGLVFFENTGTGDCVRIDAGGTPGAKVSNITFGEQGTFVVRGGPNSGHAFFVRGLVRSNKVRGRVYGCGTTKAGLLASSAVLVNFDINVTSDETGGWYQGARPQVGYSLGQRSAGEQTSYCTFITPSVQGTVFGAYLDGTLGNVFLGGDFEFCADTGLFLTAGALNNKFFGTDLEVNASRDIDCYGRYNEFHGIDSNTLAMLNAGAKHNQIVGGNYDAIQVVAGAEGNVLANVKYGRGLTGATITDNGTRTRCRDNMNLNTGLVENVPPTVVVITPTGSPFTFTNGSGNPVGLSVAGGTVAYIGYKRATAENGVGATGGLFEVGAGDSLVIAYTAAPTILKYTR